jgi:GABA permease
VVILREGIVAQHRILLVANQTLGGEELTAAVRERARDAETELWVVVPVTQTHNAMVGGFDSAVGPAHLAPDRSAAEVADDRLRDALYRFQHLGIPAAGEVSDKDPFSAVSDVLSREHFDEVIVSTLPRRVSHWLRIDLPRKVERVFGLPVTTVTAHRH